MRDLTPQQIVKELDRFIVGQESAKRAMAIALRNRYRRQRLPEEVREEVVPKNILLIGPTGVGKTEIARRVSKLVDAPFVKVEATKFTEVGYVGRDVESIVRDLVETSVNMVHAEHVARVRDRAEANAMEKLVNYLVQQSPKGRELVAALEAAERDGGEQSAVALGAQKVSVERRLRRQRKRVAEMLSQSRLDNEMVEIEVEVDVDAYSSVSDFIAELDFEEEEGQLGDVLTGSQQGGKRNRKVSVAEARRILTQQEARRLVDIDVVIDEAVRRAEQTGVVFVDELDKLVSNGYEAGAEVSGEGVQRDLLPIVEGSTVPTRYGPVRSDFVLFVAAGAFHTSKPSDLIPELQGRFPLRVELQSLDVEALERILTEPDNSLIRQYQALLGTEGVELEFTREGIEEIAAVAFEMNEKLEDIGARRLQTIMEQVLEEVSFGASDLEDKRVRIDREYVRQKVGGLVQNEDLSRFIL